MPGLLLASPTSPLGGAMIGASIGDEVSYEAPAGTFLSRSKQSAPTRDSYPQAGSPFEGCR